MRTVIKPALEDGQKGKPHISDVKVNITIAVAIKTETRR